MYNIFPNLQISQIAVTFQKFRINPGPFQIFKKLILNEEQGERCYLISANKQIESWKGYVNYWASSVSTGLHRKVFSLHFYTVSQMLGAHLMNLGEKKFNFA